MEVILLDKIDNLGGLGDKVKVKNGYARNYLIPSGKAKVATAQNLAEFEARRVELEKQSADALLASQARGKELEALSSITITAKVGSEGKLFGSIGTVDIVDAVMAAGANIERREVRLVDGNLREVGEHEVEIHLHTDVSVKITVNIEGEE